VGEFRLIFAPAPPIY